MQKTGFHAAKSTSHLSMAFQFYPKWHGHLEPDISEMKITTISALPRKFQSHCLCPAGVSCSAAGARPAASLGMDAGAANPLPVLASRLRPNDLAID